MEPTLDTLDASLPGVKALHTFSNHIQELSELENTLSEPYEMQEKNISAFCEAIMDKIKGKTREDVSLAVNAPKLNVKINPEQLERILLHLLENAAEYTPAGGKIWLDFRVHRLWSSRLLLCYGFHKNSPIMSQILIKSV